MSDKLDVTIGHYSDKGRKEINQDFHGALIPDEPLLSLKGVAVALADGITPSAVSHIAAQAAVKSFLTDYYATAESWTVKTSAQRVIAAVNSWLYAQTRRGPDPYERDKGYVCTLSVLVLKAATAHLFHIGDAAIFRVSGANLEPLTDMHRFVVSSAQSYLSRALGMNPQVEIDYEAVAVAVGDVFVLASDGVHEHVDHRAIVATIAANADDLDRAARLIAVEALNRGSRDNLTLQIVRVETTAAGEAADTLQEAAQLPPPPLLEAGQMFEGYHILRELHASSRSHLYLARDQAGGGLAVLKIPSLDQRGNEAYLKRFFLEEWVARRLASPHVLKAAPARARRYLYVASEYVEGRTLWQWMIDHPRPALETVRQIIEQVGWGLRAFHRKEMLHQDVRPANIMIDGDGTAKIIDFGSVRIAGIAETGGEIAGDMPGTAQYTAPEYLRGEGASERSDLYALAAIAYHMLSGELAYDGRMAGATGRAGQARLRLRPISAMRLDVPPWLDRVLAKALHPDPARRQEDVDEFLHDLRSPRAEFLAAPARPLLERDPLLFWKLLSLALAFIVLVLGAKVFG